mmetsp:Transcript_20392/g.40678  ORF Transcript_20392/g.40678 Transcript_20392/m.40678 type:complete len:82 (-) Transcript_20392:2-247(-)
MIFLTCIAAISDKITSGTLLQFYVINFCNAAAGTTKHHNVFLAIGVICAHFNDNNIASHACATLTDHHRPPTLPYCVLYNI